MGLGSRTNIESMWNWNYTQGRQQSEFNRRALSQHTAVAGSSVDGTVPIPATVRITKQVQGIKVWWDDLELADLKTYEVQVSNDSAFIGVSTVTDHSPTGSDYKQTFETKEPFVLLPALDADATLYYVRVRALNNQGKISAWSGTFSTSVANAIQTGDILVGEVTDVITATDAAWTALNNSNGGEVVFDASKISVDNVDADAFVNVIVTISFDFASFWDAGDTLNNIDFELRFAADGVTPVAIGGLFTSIIDLKSTIPTNIAAWGGGSPADTADNIITIGFPAHQPGSGSWDYDVLIRTDTDAGVSSGAELYVLVNTVTITATVAKR